jgi:hypothetical protein
MRNKRKNCEHISDILGNKKGKPWKRNLKRYGLWTKWNELVGPTIAQHAQPHSWQRNVLVVSVRHSTWMNELQYFREEIMEKIRESFPDTKITGIRFQLGRPDEIKHEEKPAPKNEEINLPELSKSEKEFASDTVRPLDDEATRETVRRLIEKDLALKKMS